MGFYKIAAAVLTWLFRSFLILAGLNYLYYGDVIAFILFLFTFILTLLPVMLEQLYKIELHWFVDLAVSFMVAMHMFGFYGAYLWFPFYDDFAHIMGSALVAVFGFALVYSSNYSGKIKISLPSMSFFTFIWTMAVGGVWEIIEFTWDNIVIFSHEYGFSQNSLLDTMTDLSLDAVAGICVALFCVFLVRRASKKALEGIFMPFACMIQHRKPVEKTVTASS